MKKRTINTLVIISLLVLLTAKLFIFGNLFPWTGLKAIIVIPMIYGICIAVTIIGVLLTKKYNYRIRLVSWAIIFLLNFLIAASMYPQEFRPSVLKQILYTAKVIKNFKTITKDDLELYRKDEYYSYDNSIPDDRERYVAALIKYEHELKRDGSEFMYGKPNKPILIETDIESNLETGQDKLMWWLLN